MEDIKQIRDWYIANQKYLNLAGIERDYNITPTYLVKFLKKGELYESSIYGILKFALEKGFKFQPDQCDFNIDKHSCQVFFVQKCWDSENNREAEGYEINDIQFLLGQIFDEYKRNQKK